MANGHTNYSLKFGPARSIVSETDELQFFEAQLYEAKQALFTATTVREIKFLQSKIDYLRKQMIELQKRERVKNRKKNIRGKRPKVVRVSKFKPRAML